LNDPDNTTSKDKQRQRRNDVRFTAESGHDSARLRCPLGAKSRHPPPHSITSSAVASIRLIDPGVHFTIYRTVKAGVSGGEKPCMTYQPEKQHNTVLVNVATKGSAAPLGSFGLGKITEDFVQTEATKFFARVTSEVG
jgi:hypothetical protein